MDYSQKLALSFYKQIATLNPEHNIFLVQHQDTDKIYVKKILNIYNMDVYKELATHPICGVPRIIDYFECNDQLILIEDYISGRSLDELLHTHALSLDDIIHYGIELCSILSKLHSLQPPIVHRDIKPSNIIITEYNHVVLLDFNAAKFFSDSTSSDTVLLGTKGYAAPEQYGFGTSSPKTDIYTLGILLKELTSTLQHIPTALSKIIEKCTKLNPSDRYDTIDDLSNALMQFLPQQMPHPSTTFSYHRFALPGFRSRNAWKILLASLNYFFFFWLAMSLEIENTYGAALWYERTFFYLMFLSIVFITCNYLNVQKHFSLCKSKYLVVRIFGILLLDGIVFITLFIIMLMLESLFLS